MKHDENIWILRKLTLFNFFDDFLDVKHIDFWTFLGRAWVLTSSKNAEFYGEFDGIDENGPNTKKLMKNDRKLIQS